MQSQELAALLAGERQKMVRYVRARIRETAELDAEDIVHEVFAGLLQRADITLPLEDFAAYIYRALKNRLIDLFRTRKRKISLSGDGEAESLIHWLEVKGPDALQQLQTQEGSRKLFQALERLGEMERRVVIAHELEGVSFKTMAETWGVPQNTLLSHKSRAMKKLKQYLE